MPVHISLYTFYPCDYECVVCLTHCSDLAICALDHLQGKIVIIIMGDQIGVCITYLIMEMVSWPLLNCRDDTYCHSLFTTFKTSVQPLKPMYLPKTLCTPFKTYVQSFKPVYILCTTFKTYVSTCKFFKSMYNL